MSGKLEHLHGRHWTLGLCVLSIVVVTFSGCFDYEMIHCHDIAQDLISPFFIFLWSNDNISTMEVP